MLVLFSQQVRRVLTWQGVWWLFPFCLLVPGGWLLHGYLKDNTAVLLTGLAAMATSTVKAPVRKKQRFAWAALVLLVFIWLVPVNTLLYFSVGFLLFYWMEVNGYRLGLLGILALFLSSPAFQYAAGAFSFPIRLQLTAVVGSLFSFFASAVQLKGNTIYYNGHEFAVDPACMGLHMLSLSLLLGIFLLGLLQKKEGKQVSATGGLLFIGCLFVLNLVANVFRILLLVQFAVAPQAAMHTIIGLFCLLLYVCVPACALAQALVLKAKPHQLENKRTTANGGVFHWLLLAALALVAQRINTADTFAKFKGNYTKPVAGYASSLSAPGIVKLQNEKALVYVKFIRGFYDTEHNPSMCWRGSGYAFNDIKQWPIAGNNVYTARLCNEKETLYTAWWFGNNHCTTTSQWDWRWEMLKGSASYAVINVTTATEQALLQEVTTILTNQTLSPLLKP